MGTSLTLTKFWLSINNKEPKRAKKNTPKETEHRRVSSKQFYSKPNENIL